MNKIPLYFFAYFDFEVIKTSFESIYQQASQLEIIVIENKSPSTEEKIKPYFIKLLNEGKINRYYLFTKNLANNAVEIVLGRELDRIAKSDYFFITDGDLLIYNNANWLEEQVTIIKSDPDIFSCGITLSMDNLPLNNFPEAVNWIPADKAEHPLYYEVRTGAHLLVFRSADFIAYWQYKEAQNLNFVDGTMHKFCYNIYNTKWARTKHSVARHLTWDSYSDLNHPYTKQKLSKSFKNTWYTQNYFCSVKMYTANKPAITFVDWKRVITKQVPFFIQNTKKRIYSRLSKLNPQKKTAN